MADILKTRRQLDVNFLATIASKRRVKLVHLVLLIPQPTLPCCTLRDAPAEATIDAKELKYMSCLYQ